MGKIVSVVNAKGGVGKSSVTINLAHALALADKKVLVIDVDPQCNTTSTFCGQEVALEEGTLYDIMKHNAPPERCIYPTPYENLSLLPNSPRSSLLEPWLQDKRASDQTGGEAYYVMRSALREYILANYDYCLVDNPPNLGLLVYNSMILSDAVIVPVECRTRFSVEGLHDALALIAALQDKTNPDLFFLRLLINKVDMRSAADKIFIGQTEAMFGKDAVFQTTIPNNDDFKDAEMAFKTIIRHSPQSGGAKKIRALCKEFLDVMEHSEPAPLLQKQTV